MSYAYAIAQSSKLSSFESSVFQSVEQTKHLAHSLATDGHISLSKLALNRYIGRLFVQETNINLFSNILDNPDFLWEDDEYLPAYLFTRQYLEIDSR
jgi:uncharacterized Rmd1/YagE family protein